MTSTAATTMARSQPERRFTPASHASTCATAVRNSQSQELIKPPSLKALPLLPERPAYRALNDIQISSALSSSRQGRRSSAEASPKTYASLRGNQAKSRRPQPAISASSSLPTPAHKLHLYIDKCGSFSAELGLLLSDPDTVSDPSSTLLKLKNEPENNTNISSTLTDLSTVCTTSAFSRDKQSTHAAVKTSMLSAAPSPSNTALAARPTTSKGLPLSLIPSQQKTFLHSQHNIHIPQTMVYPSPPLQPTLDDSTSLDPSAVPSLELKSSTLETKNTTSEVDRTHPSPLVSCTYTYTYTASIENDEGDCSPSRASLSDCVSTPSRGSSSVSSVSSVSSRSHKSYQLQDNPDSGSRMTVTPLQIFANGDFTSPVPQKSEDWAVLVDTPASPVEAYHHGMVPRPWSMAPHQLQSTSSFDVAALTDSPAPEEGADLSGSSTDYMQHISQEQQHLYQQQYQQYYNHTSQRLPLIHAQTDPTGMHGSYPYQYHQQQHSSTPSAPLALAGGATSTSMPYRRSWSASETFSGAGAGMGRGVVSVYGYLTPPRFAEDPLGRSRPPSRTKSSVATSVSLLTDAAILAKYRDTAIKTNDASIQLSYAKYLLEIGEPSFTYTPVSMTAEASNPPSPRHDSFPAESGHSTPSSSSSSLEPSSPTTPQQDTQLGKKQLTQEAIYWIDRLAKEGQPEAQFIRGTWYESGLYGFKRNPDKAIRWYQSASKGDWGPAQYKFACYCEGKKDNNKAVMHYKKAAIHNDANANQRLAMVYLHGDLGQSKNMKAGLQYLKRAASLATESAPKAPYILGLILCREYQLAIPDDIAFPDDSESLEWIRKSAQLGYSAANYKLGYCYEYGCLGCPVDPFLSIQHYERAVLAADESNGEAEMALSGWYLSGAENYFLADDQLAFQYASLAAEKKLPKAQYAMGYYHEVGISVPVDMDKAMEFYRLAAADGNKDAITRLEKHEEQKAADDMSHRSNVQRMKQDRRAKNQSCNIM